METISKRRKIIDAIVIGIIISILFIGMIIGHKKRNKAITEFKSTAAETVLLTYKKGYTDAFAAMFNNDTINPAKQFKIDSVEFVNNYNFF